MRFHIKRLLTVLLICIFLFAFSLTVFSASRYDLNNDKVVDIRDLICAKQSALTNPQTNDATRLVKIKRILLGIEKDNDSSIIYTPEVP